MLDNKASVRTLINSPSDLAVALGGWYDGIQSDVGVKFDLPSVDQFVIPMRPGDLTCFVGRPGHGKSTLLAYFAKKEAEKMAKAGDNRIVIYVSWEQSAEEIDTFFMSDGEFSSSDIAWGRVPRERVMRKLAKRAGFPLWVIGHSIARAGKPTPRMTLDRVLEAIETIEDTYDTHPKPALLLFDYLQLIPVSNARDRVSQVLEAPGLIKELAQRVGVPAICAVQASREVDDLRLKIPQPRHSQWGSSIEQTADKIFGLWRPIKTELPDREIEVAPGKTYFPTDDLLIMQMTKQRFETGIHTWGLRFQPQWLKLQDNLDATRARVPDDFRSL